MSIIDIPVQPKKINALHRRQHYTVEFDPVMGVWQWRIVVTRTYKTSGACTSIAAAQDAAKARIDMFMEGADE